MILQIFTVYDSKTQAYLPPFYEPSIGGAVRSFSDACQQEDHVFNKHSADFTLFHIGEFDDQNSKIEMHKTPISLGLASENLQPHELHAVETS